MEISDNRRTALALVLAIVAVRMLLSGRIQAVWSALWGPALGLGTEALIGAKAGPPAGLSASGNPTNSTPTTTTPTTTPPSNGPNIQTF